MHNYTINFLRNQFLLKAEFISGCFFYLRNFLQLAMLNYKWSSAWLLIITPDDIAAFNVIAVYFLALPCDGCLVNHYASPFTAF